MREGSHALLILLSLIALLLVPVTAPAQTPSRAGVVTTLEGSVTARRVALPDPVPLKFKDDVFLQDTVTTGDKALARMLLGGKAVVTVRERSVLTITEVPGRTTIELANGKFALAVARERMQPGEEIQIRTPNAIAGVRGTVVITEVLRQGAQTSGVPAVVTNFYVLRGTILAQGLDPSSGLPSGTPLSVGAMHSYSVAGAAQPRVAPIPPEQVAQITSGLQPTGPKAGSEAGQEQAKSQAMQATLGLLGALTGGAMDRTLAQAIVAPPATANLGDLTSLTGPVVVPKNPPFEQGSIACDPSNAIPGCGTTGLASLANLPPPTLTIAGLLSPDALAALLAAAPPSQSLLLTGPAPLTLPPGSSLKRFKGTTISTARVPLVRLRNASIVQGGSDDLIGADADAAVFLAGALAEVIDSIVVTGGAFFGVRGGTVVSTATTPFIFFDPVNVTTADSLIALTGGTLGLAGALFQDVGGTLNLGSHLLLVASGVLAGTGGDALIQLADTAVTAGSNLIQANGLIQGTDPTFIALAGPLLISENSEIVAASNLVRIAEGAGLFSTTTSPLVAITGGSFTGGGPLGTFSGGSLLSMFSQAGRPGSRLTLAGPFAAIANAEIRTTDAHTFDIGDGSTITSTTGSPFASFSSSFVEAFHFFNLETNSVPVTMSLAGSLVESIDTTITSFGGADDASFFRMRNGVTLTQTGSSPLLRLTGALPGDFTADGGGDFAQLTSGTAASPHLSLQGQFLVATAASFDWRNFFAILDGSSVTSATTLPFLAFDGSFVRTAGSFLSLRRSRAGTPSRLTLAGPLLSAVNDTFLVHGPFAFGAGSGTAPTVCCSGFFIGQGAELVSTTTSALIQLINANVFGGEGGAFFEVADTFGGAPAGELVAPARVALAGPLLQATNSFVQSLFEILAVTRSTFISTTTAPLLTLNASVLTVGGLADPFTGVVQNPQIIQVTSGASPALLSLAGPALRAIASQVFGGEILLVLNFLNGATFASTTTLPLVQLDGTNLFMAKPVFVNTGFSVFSALACPAAGCVLGSADGTFATMNVRGGLLSASNGSSVNTTGALVFVGDGGQIIVNGSTDPLVLLTGGLHALATNVGAIFDLRGRATATAVQNVDGVALDLGTDEAIRHGGAFFETDDAIVNTQATHRLDTVLVQASAPLLNLRPGSNITSVFDAIDLAQKATLTSLGPVVKLDGSILTVNFGALVSVRNGSLMRVTGDFLSLRNASTLNLQNGAVLNVIGNSVVNITGAFVNFGGTGGNAINVSNGFCGGSCTVIGGLNVNLINGAVAGNVSITNPIKNGTLGAINAAANTAVINVSGANSKVTISGN